MTVVGALVPVLAAAGVLLAGPAPARGERAPCAPGAVHRGHAIDLDLRAADLHDALRLIAEAGAVNLVVAGDVAGTVTVRLRRVPWDLALCTVAHLGRLTVVLDGGIYRIAPVRGRG